METTFTTITYKGKFVNTNLLEKGIYFQTTPILYDKNMSLEKLIANYKIIANQLSDLKISNRYFENLALCELTTVSLTFLPERELDDEEEFCRIFSISSNT